MIVYENEKLIFSHVPKTAGTTIHQLLLDNGYKGRIVNNSIHSPLFDSDVDLDKYTVFFVLRNPHERVVSMYEWFRQNNNQGDLITHPHKSIAKEHSFSEWLDMWFLPEGKSYDYYMLSKDGEWCVNDLVPVRMTHLEEDLEGLFEYKDIKVDLSKKKHIYKIKHKPWEQYYEHKDYYEVYDKEEWAYKVFSFG